MSWALPGRGSGQGPQSVSKRVRGLQGQGEREEGAGAERSQDLDQVDRFREVELRNEALFPAAETWGRSRQAAAFLPGPQPSTPQLRSQEGQAAKGLKACLFQGRACAMAYRADSDVGGGLEQSWWSLLWGLGWGAPGNGRAQSLESLLGEALTQPHSLGLGAVAKEQGAVQRLPSSEAGASILWPLKRTQALYPDP